MILETKDITIAYRCPECGSCVTSPIGVFTLSGDLYRLKCPCGKSMLEITMDGDTVRLRVPCIACPGPHNYTLSRSLFFSRDIFVLSCSFSGIGICFLGRADKVKKAFDDSTLELADIAGVGRDDIDFDDLPDKTPSAKGGKNGSVAPVTSDDAPSGADGSDSAGNSDNSDNSDSSDSSDSPDDSGNSENSDSSDDDAPPAMDPPDAYTDTVISYLLREITEAGQIRCLCQHKSSQHIAFEFTHTGIRVFCKTCGASKELDITTLADASEKLNCDHLDLDE